MSKQKDQFIALLGELFQLNQPELDFGLYRILHARSAQIKTFIDTELGSEIDAHFAGQSQSNAHDALEAARVKVAETLGEDAFLPTGELKPEYRGTKVGKELELAQQHARDGGGVLADDAQVYEHLYRFFSRYYDKGDFMSKRYFVAENDSRAAPYAVPYDGREVMLHWANKDQYYIKSSEALSNFTFELTAAQAKELGPQSGFDFLPPATTPLKVHFRLAAAAEGEHNNVKEGQERFFIIHAAEPLKLETNDKGLPELVVQFDYRPDSTKSGQAGTWQQKRLAEAEQVVGEQLANLVFKHPELRSFEQPLFAPAPTDKQPNRTLLAKYLGKFIAPHTMDYFIHKNLGGFLRRELDFYIKNEIIRLDDIEADDAPRVDEYLKKLRVLRKIARRIIAFLAQLEDFQKKLWLKKKFVIDTQYFIPLALVPERLHSEVFENPAQQADWKKHKLSGSSEKKTGQILSAPEFIKQNPGLIVDTSLFNSDFKQKAIAQIPNLDDETNGILLNSDNFQGLSLIKRHFQDKINSIFIDPPYNTGKNDFPYKDNYQHSSWMSMMQDRCNLAKDLLSPKGLFSVQIGDEETANVRCVFDSIFAERKNSIIVRRGIKNVQAQFDDIDRLSLGHDTIHTYSKCSGLRLPHLKQTLDEEKPGKWDTFWRGTDRKTMRYELLGITPETGQWRWEINRALRAVKAYDEYLQNESARKTLDEYYIENLQAGVDLDFVKLSDEGVAQYYVPPQAARLVSDNWLDIAASGNITDFQHEKSLPMLQRLISWSSDKNDWTLDYFAGSGSTGHAALSMPDSRRFILIEMGEHFEKVLTPRIKNAIYQKSLEAPKESKIVKIQRLESFEDTLNNLQLPDTPRLNSSTPESSEMTRDYMLKYWLEFETTGSPSLLNVREFTDPTSYKLKVKQPGSDAQVEKTIDLVETFNWLIGLHVAHLDQPRSYAIELVREADPELPKDQDTRWRSTAIKERDDGEFWFRAVEGHILSVPGDDLSRERVLVIWRKLTGDSGRDQAALEAWLNKRGINPRESEFEHIYVNGNHALPSDGDAATRVRLIEETFAQRMWEDA
ncbi:site-specific DNA-methyltransferase [Pseudomonas tolaasii]|uniref:DNA methyltransferase n=1 Tax=Pseudomonas tolaasii TaxID=29442 RepID=UPI001CA771A4|nr:site-specific DNA-methyltransferase [Pseudomonas tolaasii]MBY8941096.1 site-specific DNA-methyltransferase [Pseudomonas tolaasii]